MQAFQLGTLATFLASTLGTLASVRPVEKDSKRDVQVKELGDVKKPTAKFGAVVVSVTEGGPATKGSTDKEGTSAAELEKEDVITQIDGKDIKSAKDYYELMKGETQKELTVIDQRTGSEEKGYFKPEKGALGIKFYIIPKK